MCAWERKIHDEERSHHGFGAETIDNFLMADISYYYIWRQTFSMKYLQSNRRKFKITALENMVYDHTSLAIFRRYNL